MEEKTLKDRIQKVIDETKEKPFVLATVNEAHGPETRWMGAVVRDPECEWTFYMECGAQSRKMKQLAANPAAQILIQTPDFSSIVTLSGTAGDVACAEVKKRIWDAIPGSGDYFASPEDPNFGVIKFTAKRAEFLCIKEAHEPYCLEVGS